MIVTTIEQIKNYSSVYASIDFDVFSDSVVSVEQEIAKKVLGEQLYDILGGNSLTTKQESLKKLVEQMIVGFVLYEAFPKHNIDFAEGGIKQTQSNTHQIANMWAYNDARLAYFRQGDNARELVYNYLQNNVAAFPEWVSSSSFSIHYQFLLNSNSQLHQIIGKGENTNTYLTLTPYISFSQEVYIQPLLGDLLLSSLLAKIKTQEPLTTYEMRVIDLAQKAMAWLSLMEALPTVKYIIVDGVMLTAFPAQSSKTYQPVNEQETIELKKDAKMKGEKLLSMLKTYLYQNASNIPEYDKPNNDEKNGFQSTRHSVGLW